MVSLILLALGLLLTSTSSEKICSDKECSKIAEEFLSNMDASVNPCENFYKFACGKYAANNPIPKDELQVSPATKVNNLLERQLIEALEEPFDKNEAKHFRNLKKYYNSCIKTDRIEEIGLKEVKKILEQLGGWPVVEDRNPDIGWESVIYGLTEFGFDSDYLMELYVDADSNNSTIRILSIGTLSSPLKQVLRIKDKSDPTIKAYYDFMVRTAMVFGAKEETAKQDMDLALDLEIYLIKETKTHEDIAADISELYNMYSIEKLEIEFPGIPWGDYIENVTPKTLKIPRKTEVNLLEPEYTKSLIKILKTTPPRVIRNYIIWQAIWDILQYLNKELRDLQEEFIAVLLGESEELPRSKECLRIITQDYLTVLSALYVRKYFDQHSKTIATELVTYIREQFEITLNETKWQEQDKYKAIEKIKILYEHVGFPNELLDDEKLNSLYKNLEINEDFLQTALTLQKFQTNFEYSRLFLPINKTDWIDFSNSAVVNAFYKFEANAIIIPAGILQGNFFNAKLPHYLNFGGIGFVIGHELSHGFDNIGRQFNKDGAVENWWSDVAEQDFAVKKLCLTNQFNNFTLLGEKINGNLTVGENIADFGGQKTSYLSYQNWRSRHNEEPGLPGLNFTNNQLFWIAVASNWCSNEKEELTKLLIISDTHAPNEFRINGPMSNLDFFSKDFNCPLGSNMNPEKKCTPW